MENLIADIHIFGHWGYAILFLAAFLESAAFLGLIFPGESIVLLAGFVSSRGYLTLPDCILVIALGAVLGDSAGYSLGRMVGKDYFHSHKRFFLFKERHLEKAQVYFDIYGGKTIFLGRFIGILRALAPFIAGISSMRYSSFLAYNVAGGVIWAITFTLLGFYFGESWQQVEEWSGRAGAFFLFMFLVLIGFIMLYRKMLRERGHLLIWFRAIVSSPMILKFRKRHPRFVEFMIKRVSPGYYLGLHLTIGLAISSVFIWIFGGITEDILTGDPFVTVDDWVVAQILYFRSPMVDDIMKVWTQFGGGIFLTVASILVIIFLLEKNNYYLLSGFAAAMIGGSILLRILKIIIRRARPSYNPALIHVGGWSFPSGHAVMSVIFYGMITYILLKRITSARVRIFLITLACFMIFIIGFSRIYLGVHYLSDVIAGFVGGSFWLTVCITGLEIYALKENSLVNQNSDGITHQDI